MVLIVACIISAAITVGMSPLAKANELELVGTATLTTDYISQGISQTNSGPAVQASFDATYGMFYAGIWGSNVDFGADPVGNAIATIEIDYYAGVTPEWNRFHFDIGGFYYTYPGAFDPGGNFDYFELKTGAAYKFGQSFTFGLAHWWSPEFSGEIGDANRLDVTSEYAFTGKLFDFFSPSISGLIAWQWTEVANFTFWNAGITLHFLDKWSADVRYWDTDLSDADCIVYIGSANNCHPRVVGTVTASF